MSLSLESLRDSQLEHAKVLHNHYETLLALQAQMDTLTVWLTQIEERLNAR